MDASGARGWVTPAFARQAWPDAPKLDATLDSLLVASYELCVAYAPSLAVPDPQPETWKPAERAKHAQVLHARAVWTAARARGEVYGMDDPNLGLAISTTAMSGQVKQLLRPPGAPKVG